MASRFKHRKLFLLPVAKKDSANTSLARHGLGSDNFCLDAVDKVEGKTVTHAGSAVVADDAMLTILRKVCDGVDKTYKEKPRPVDLSLDQESLKRKVPTIK